MFGRYQIVRLLGSGGMGQVYHAWDQELGEAVALKIIRREFAANPDADARFKRELSVARQVTHKNVVRIHDLGQVEGVKYISMSYIEGIDLATMMNREKLPLELALSIARQVCAGLLAAHEAGVVHRDLKPANVMVDSAGHAYLMDFGLARSVEATQYTSAGVLMGTVDYMSPEQAKGESADHRSDIYALGLMLFELVTGERPFKGDTAMTRLAQRLHKPAPDPRVSHPDLPPYLGRIIVRCLARDPAERYQGVQDILADLDAHQAAATPWRLRLAALAPEWRAWRWGVNHVTVSFLALLAFSAVIALAVGTTRHLVQPREATSGPTRGNVSHGPLKRLAVLPFPVIGDEAAYGYIAQGVIDALSAKLFQLGDLNVASAAAVERINKKTTPERIARELGVTLLVSGTVQGAGERIRIIANLDDVAAGRRLWTQEFSGLPADLLTIEDQIYSGLTGGLKVTPTDQEVARTAAHPTENIEAYARYLKGRNAMRGQQDLKNVEAAIGLYQEALKSDPGFALAYAGIADSAVRMYRGTKDGAWAAQALSAAQQAQRLDEKLVEVHLALGNVYQATGKNAEALAELTRASELAPNSDDVYRRLARAYLAGGQGTEAIRAYQRAVGVNPYYWVTYNSLGAAYLKLGAYEKAAQAFSKVIELEPENVNGYNDLGAAFLFSGRYREAVSVFEKALKLQVMPETYTNLGIAYSWLGQFRDAVPMYEKAVELAPNSEAWTGNLADGYRWVGQKDKAIAVYDKAIALAYKELQVNPRNAITKAHVALYYAKKGDAAQAHKLITDARMIDSANVDLIYDEALILLLGNRTPEALDQLGKAFKAGYAVSIAANDPDMAGLRSDPRFAQLARQWSTKSR